MPFADLYSAVQQMEGRISTKPLTTLAIEHSEIKEVDEAWSGYFEPYVLRGCYIEGPGKWSCISIKEHAALIVLSREMCASKPNGNHWRRLVFTKELMHVFDTPEEKADTEEKFDLQIQKFADPTVAPSPQYRAETKAVWRAFMALCPEKMRKKFKKQLRAGDITLDYVAAALHIPVEYTHFLFQDNFEEIVGHLKEG